MEFLLGFAVGFLTCLAISWATIKGWRDACSEWKKFCDELKAENAEHRSR